MRAVWILAVACSVPSNPSTPSTPAKPAPPPDLSRAVCDKPHDWRPSQSFAGSDRVAHLRVTAARFGPEWEQRRCGFVELELVEALRGAMPKRMSIVISQSTITRYTSRPAGAWWVVEQSLEVGSDYVAFCPAGASLEGTCTIADAKNVLADVTFARAAAELPDINAVMSRVWSDCALLGHVSATYVWERFRAESLKDWTTYRKVIGLVEHPSCNVRFRDTLFHAAQDPTIGDSLEHATTLAQVMFGLLAMPSAIDLHDNLIGTWIPTQIGLEGGRKLTARQVFGNDRKRWGDATYAISKNKDPKARLLVPWLQRYLTGK